MLTINRKPGQRFLELGGGDRPIVHPACLGGPDCAVDVRPCYTPDGKQTVDFTADFNQPLPISSNEFDGVVCVYCLEHLSYLKVPQFLRELYRVLKPGGEAVVITSNTAAQLEWMAAHPDGWDGKDFHTASSELLMGSQDYPENSHKCFFNPDILRRLFVEAGFRTVDLQPFGERSTDIKVEAVKINKATEAVSVPNDQVKFNSPDFVIPGEEIVRVKGSVNFEPGMLATVGKDGIELAPTAANATLDTPEGRAYVFSKAYFNGGGHGWGGYAHGPGGSAYADFACHYVTLDHILARKPSSVLEIGAARGYIGKRLEDAGIPYTGLEISKHCYLTRASDGVIQHDMCVTPWPFKANALFMGGSEYEIDKPFDLNFSIATLEHIPEKFLPAVIGEMQRTCKRGFHGIDFGGQDDGFDKSHCSLHDKPWWEAMFAKYAPGWPVEIVDKEDLERGAVSEAVFRGDGKTKLNIGSWTTMYYHGWTNVDVGDLNQYAASFRYNFRQHDVRQGLPWNTGSVDCIMLHHFLEHLSYQEALTFLRECRRVIKPGTGAMRIVVPDANFLARMYVNDAAKEPPFHTQGEPVATLAGFGEINDGAADAPTPLSKLWALLLAGHQAAYDNETLEYWLEEAGWEPMRSKFRDRSEHPGLRQIMAETTEMPFGLSLFMNAVPRR